MSSLHYNFVFSQHHRKVIVGGLPAPPPPQAAARVRGAAGRSPSTAGKPRGGVTHGVSGRVRPRGGERASPTLISGAGGRGRQRVGEQVAACSSGRERGAAVASPSVVCGLARASRGDSAGYCPPASRERREVFKGVSEKQAQAGQPRSRTMGPFSRPLQMEGSSPWQPPRYWKSEPVLASDALLAGSPPPPAPPYGVCGTGSCCQKKAPLCLQGMKDIWFSSPPFLFARQLFSARYTPSPEGAPGCESPATSRHPLSFAVCFLPGSLLPEHFCLDLQLWESLEVSLSGGAFKVGECTLEIPGFFSATALARFPAGRFSPQTQQHHLP